MANGQKLCMSCMRAVPAGSGECPHCSYNGSQRNPSVCLPIGCRLAGKYVVGRRLEDDGSSVSYIAYDISKKTPVELREFLPHGGCQREDHLLQAKPGAELHYKTALMDFCELYRSLLKISELPSLIPVLDFFEANGTAYAVFERFEGGISLKKFLSMSGGSLPFDKCFKLLGPVLDALEAIHSVNLIHRGVSPETIFVNRNGDVKLGGFATSSVRTKDAELKSKMQSGYSAPEQYSTT
ncbi:MAG: protein kinase, partial [Oscillospiraceae bacterium]|nr:protein kinase [Oscillospiraceae bacterium]